MLTSASRPPTSKPRGVCRYYTHPRGCFAGDKCKFLHGESSQATPEQPLLTPYDKSKTCRYYQNGFCRRGDKCWFLHVVGNNIQGEGSIVLEEPSDDDLCSVCFEKPVTFGLLTGCSHVFCITCIRQWRDPSGKGGDMVDSGNTKKCPMCRTPSRFITPSSRFFKQEDPEKDKIVQTYKESMAKVPCRYFRQSKQKDKNNLLCPFGKDCFYQHLNDDGTPYIFKDGVEVCMGVRLQLNSVGICIH
ncbi:hypothetical protein BDQ17DRAFT_1239535 [Cyathus striatus]|nr:hypothetical protein BDQ17DRAFT_1239535 [Cyathus striatus]